MSRTTTSERQSATSRANGRKSRGPKTPAGKARSSRNALKHGLLARYIIPADDPVEDPNEFNALVEELIREYEPRGLFETLCVKRIAACIWRLDRAARFESVTINQARQRTQGPLEDLARSYLGTPAPDLANFVLPNCTDLDRLVRYEYMIDRELQRTLTQLRQHRADQSDPSQNSSLITPDSSLPQVPQPTQHSVLSTPYSQLPAPNEPEQPPQSPPPPLTPSSAQNAPADPSTPSMPSAPPPHPSPRNATHPAPQAPNPPQYSVLSTFHSVLPPPAPNEPEPPPSPSSLKPQAASPALTPPQPAG